MNKIKAKKITEELIKKYNLDFTCKFSNRMTTCFGECRYRIKQIVLSTGLVKANDEKTVKTVILHEIAHALCPKHGHNFVWKQMCQKIGGDGKIYYNPELVQQCTQQKKRERKNNCDYDYVIRNGTRIRVKY